MYHTGFNLVLAHAGLPTKTAAWPFGPDLDKATEDAISGRSAGFYAQFPLEAAHALTGRKLSPFNIGARMAPGLGSMYGTRDLDLKYQLGAAIGGEVAGEGTDQVVSAIARHALRGNLPDEIKIRNVKIPLSPNVIASLIGGAAGEGAARHGIWAGLQAADEI